MLVKVAILDIGTNSLIVLAIETDGPEVKLHFEQSLEPRLGEDLQKTGKLSSRAIERTIRAATRLLSSTGWLKVDKVIAFGTHVLRVAENSKTFIEKFKERTNNDILILTPEQEAHLSCKGALVDLNITSDYAIIDVGGGSTEISISDENKTHEEFFSFPIGAVTMTERLSLEPPLTEKMQNDINTYLSSIFLEKLKDKNVSTIIGSGGTATSIAMINLHLDEFKPEKIHCAEFECTSIHRLYENLSAKSLDELRGIVFFAPGRADIITAGVGIYEYLTKLFNADKFVVSQKGVRWGVALNYQEFL